MQVVQTAGAPPNLGKAILAIIGCTQNSRNAPRNAAEEYSTVTKNPHHDASFRRPETTCRITRLETPSESYHAGAERASSTPLTQASFARADRRLFLTPRRISGHGGM